MYTVMELLSRCCVPQFLTGRDTTGSFQPVHQCACFCNNPKLSHEQAIKHICHYLHSTRSKGLFFLPDLHAGFTCHVDADWAGNWLKS